MNRIRKTAGFVARKGRTFAFLAIGALALAGVAIDRMAAAEEQSEAEETRVGSALHYPDLDQVRQDPLVPSQYVSYEGFSLSFNPGNRTPNYVAWELLGSETAGEARRTNRFWQDKKVKGCPSTDDYKSSGYDRGHMCPAADQKWSEDAMRQCFVLANICPQDHALNTGAWNTLEDKTRQWARRDSALIVIAGPVYAETDTLRIGKAGVRVPSMFFKVLLAPYAEEPRAIGFLFPNMSSPGRMDDYAMSVDEIERIAGMDFFASLPDEIEKKVEASFSLKAWNRRK